MFYEKYMNCFNLLAKNILWSSVLWVYFSQLQCYAVEVKMDC